MEKKIFKRKNKLMHLAEAFYTNLIIKPILPYISKTSITPNSITILNIVISIFIYYLGFIGNLKLVAILIQIYLFLDILDGNLARYKNQFSKVGAKLDSVSDSIFYNMIFICIGYNRVRNIKLILVLILVNLYAIIPTVYIVPRLKKLKHIKRFGIKNKMMKIGYIIGMDLGTVDFITSIFTFQYNLNLMYDMLIVGYIIDLIYRIFELKYNEKINL